MNNIKGFAIISDGNLKRMAITYDEIDNNGKVLKSNNKINRVIVDDNVLEAVRTLEGFALNATVEQ